MRARWMLIAVAAALLATACLTNQGCRKQQDENAVVIWWAQWAPSDGLQELAAQFEQETGIPVVVHQIPWDSYQQQVFLEFGNQQTAFDIVVGDSQWIGRGATEGLYLNLTEWLPKAVDLQSIQPNVLTYICQYPSGSDQYFAAPCESDAVGFAYRKDWFEDPAEQQAFRERYGRDLAVPQTWAEYREVAEFFTRPDQRRYGGALLTGRGYDSLVMGFQMFLWQWGGAWHAPGDPAQIQGFVNAPESVEALQAFIDLLQFGPPGKENLDYSGTLEAFRNGSTAMAMDYFAFFPDLVTEMGEKVGFFVVPAHVVNGQPRRAVSLGGQGFSISTKVPAERQARAKQFIEWFLQRSVQEQWVQKPAGFTSNADILQSEAFRQANPYNGPLADSMEHMRDFHNVPQYNELLSVAQRYLAEAIDGTVTPQEAMDRIAAEQAQILQAAQPAGQ